MSAFTTIPLQKEKVMDEDHPMRAVTSVKKKKFIQPAVEKMKEKGTVGSLTRLAHAAGESTSKFAHEHYHDKSKVGAKSRFDVNLNG
jgi:hypothetical protein